MDSTRDKIIFGLLRYDDEVDQITTRYDLVNLQLVQVYILNQIMVVISKQLDLAYRLLLIDINTHDTKS